MDNLLGGNDDGHYHLTEGELEKLKNMPAEGTQGVDGRAATIQIGTVTTGAAGSSVSITNTGTYTDAVLNFIIPQGKKGDKGDKGADGADGLQGPQGVPGIQGPQGIEGKSATIQIGTVTSGDSPKVTNSGTSVNAVFNFTLPKGDKGDKGEDGEKGDPFTFSDFTPAQIEALKGEKGDKGDTFNFEDLTEEQLETLKDNIGAVSNHEELTNLQGGTDGEFYHMTATEYRRLKILVGTKGFFPYDDTDDIYIPYIDARDPDNPVLLPYTPFENLPKGTPPEWNMATLPSEYSINNGVGEMYYGGIPSYSNDMLLVKLYRNNQYVYATTDVNFSYWGVVDLKAVKDGIIKIDNDYLYNNTTSNLILKTNTAESYTYYFYSPVNNNTTYKVFWGSGQQRSILAATVSPELGVLLIAGIKSTSGIFMKKLKGTDPSQSASYTQTTLTGFLPTNNGLVWSPDAQIFCACGTTGIATSADGERWMRHSNAPKNLTDLSYREDLGCLFARCIDDKCFYVSGDGAEWQKLTSTPIPLETVSCVDYSPETKLYCAVGGTGKYAYFSKDLNTWAATTITNGADISMGSVIYMPSTKKYVLMPTSGSYYYTFDPSAWID